MNDMTVDVIIPTYHPDDKLDQLLKMLQKQTLLPRHIYIMNTEETLFHSRIADKMDHLTVTHIKKSEFDHGGTRNRGAAMSNADLLLFVTQDAIFADEYVVANLKSAFSDPQVAVSFARQLVDPKDNYLEYYTRLFNYPAKSRKKTIEDLEELGIKTFFCSNVCAMYRREEYEKAGGFVKKAIFNEDMMMAATLLQRGKAIYYMADARVYHWHNYSAFEQMRRNFDVAVSQQDAGGLFTKVKSEKEGIKLVKKTCSHMLTHKHWYLVPKVIWQSGFKFIGYKLGQRYKKLPMWLIRKISLNPKYWDHK